MHQIYCSHVSCLHSVFDMQLCRAQAMNCRADLQNITAQEFRVWVVPRGLLDSWKSYILSNKSGFEANAGMSCGKERKLHGHDIYCHLELHLFLFILQSLYRFCQLCFCHRDNQLPSSGSAAGSPSPMCTRIHLCSLLLHKLLQSGPIFCLTQKLSFLHSTIYLQDLHLRLALVGIQDTASCCLWCVKRQK